MKVIFLDIDGVLNNEQTNAKSPDGYIGIGNTLLKRLSSIVKETNARIVLSSTWKSEWDKNESLCSNDGKYMVKKFRQLGLLVFDKIEDIDNSLSTRGAAIMKYLEYHSEVEEWVVIDDDEFDFAKYPEIMDRFVHTDHLKGLVEEDVKKAIELLSKEKDLDM
jgi:hypothetical protein